MDEEQIEAEETSPGYFKSHNWCPVCGKTLHEDFDYCPMPEHKGVMTLKVYSYKPKRVTLPMVGIYDVESDDFEMDEGLVQRSKLSQKDTDWLEGVVGLTEKQLVSLMAGEIKRRRRLRADGKGKQ